MIDKATLKKVRYFEKHIYKEFKALGNTSQLLILKWRNNTDKHILALALQELEKLKLLKYEINYLSSKVHLTGLGKNRISNYSSWV